MAAGWLPASCDFQPRELRPQRLLPYRSKPHDELGVVIERLHAHDGSLTEFRMANPGAWSQTFRNGLILVLVGINRPLLPSAARASPVSTRAEWCEGGRIRRCGRRVHLVDELARNFVHEPRRVGRLVFSENPPPCRRGEDESLLGAGDAHVA